MQALQGYGQSVWLDYIRRSLLTSGELARLIEEDGLRGVTSNPAIFEKAITGSTDYVEMLHSLTPQYRGAKSLYEQVAVRDIQEAADVLRRVYEQTQRRDGYVSLEVSPDLARDTAGTLAEARRLWRQVGRPNVMIKVPATPEGIPAIEPLISEGINVNVTLLFGQEAYEQVVRAYIAGLERRAAQGGDLHHVASVASFFISRIDTAVDALLGEWLGWLGLTEEHAAHSDYLTRLAAEAESRLKDAGVTHALLLGMGGSSLGPEVLQMTFGSRQGFPPFYVLDSTDPAQIKAFENTIDLAQTLFIVSSKSGSTLEPNIFKQYFFQRVQERWASKRRATASSPSLTPAPSCSTSPRARASGACSSASPASADGIQPCRILAWSRPRSWASTSRASWITSRRWCTPARRRSRWRRIPLRCWASSWACWPTTVAIKSRSSPRPGSGTSAPGWSSSWRSPRARTARA